ncbi:hypothetical protein DB88DRAFT_475930 [Papiliotrema laurentii]|uniref:DUF2264 domain-containing protein n=1 Tax=Papiliotrema laurentii TaxID=5418 RepID=A0AAD9L8U1_PAPLA|nr:hypothetical protein DB88DRAFT_475930 [Papiliotrema laurentii]
MVHSLPPAVQAITENPVSSRDDLVKLLKDLLVPLHDAQSSGGARIRLGNTGTHFDNVAAEMEGFARALWGLTPLLAHDANAAGFEDLRDAWVKGLANGADPEQVDEYWGDCTARDQRFVEMAALGFSLALAPKVFWEPLSDSAKKKLNAWLLSSNDFEMPDNNWRFFRVLINVGLKKVGAEYSQEAIDKELAFIETFYGEHGLPADGPNDRCTAYDYYATSFAIPFYSLIYARLCSDENPERAALYRKRAVQNLPLVVNLFAPDGAPIPFGRSMTYRFAVCCFFSAVAYDSLDLPEPFTWGVIQGLVLRTVRYFTTKPEVFNRDGSLSIGYLTPNMFMSEDYNSAQSPYWALKAFLVLALSDSHPFWQAKEEPYPQQFLESPFTPIKPWMQVFSHAGGHTFCLTSGQRSIGPFRQSAAKYGKFAYSSAFGFSVPTGALDLQQHAPDSMLALSDDGHGERWVVRREATDVSISDDGVIKSTWTPWPDVEVLTWLIPPPTAQAGYHTRIHKLTNRSSRTLQYAEGGFAIHSHFGPHHSERRFLEMKEVTKGGYGRYESDSSALAVSRAGVSGVVDMLGSGRGKVQDTDGNSNLIAVRTVIPMIMGQAGEGETWIAVRIYALPAKEGKVGRVGEGWVDEWKGLEKDTGDLDRLRELYPFINEL